MKEFKKTCSTSVRVLTTLKILYNQNASIQDIIRYFEKIDPYNRIYTNEVILKYINTLKVFGLRIIKQKNKYVLLNAPSQFEFDEKDLKTIYFIEKSLELLPEERIKIEVTNFLQELEKRFSDNTSLIACNIKKPDSINLKFNYKKYEKQIREYEKYCTDGLRLKITYKTSNEQETSVMVNPNEIKYRGHEVYFSVYNTVFAQTQDICLDHILKVEQLPLKSASAGLFSSVTFELKSRLAKAYKLHEGEKLLNVLDNGNIIILNQKEDRGLLLKRLMKYGENCELISPKSLRKEMLQLIKETLSNYC